MLQSKPIFAVLLAVSFLFGEAHGLPGTFFLRGKAIGYASVSAELGERINREGNRLLLERSPQDATLGPGFYLLNDLNRLPHVDGNWYCAVRASRRRLKKINKVYIPESWTNPQTNMLARLWGQGERTIMDYIVKMGLVKEPAEALRFSWVQGMSRQMQMLIPSSVFVHDNSLDLRAKCDVEREFVKGYGGKPVNWQDEDYYDIKGDSGTEPAQRNQ
ncbi:uncharacterized protein L3040_002574 [Drepanopeziza brunnea f. sp. 'multigermtubi']|uniref:Uncharacterized protein n=1 Tax=Marssonina brunnea f. sp. multigermtubi (strain MB_m1) TaxID=1072389 RepID=K1X2V3_MARBU|nr:uncharacterized protein MBM_02783 [Drepanopeziza brunnea f. sp. 'multigermtubi' MB_m1]EKD19546.1 hypothetical protein MBM_02783 [Drepanopeziza brunnea f. sp. 'multigermtubi' MB_m1]KAJ5050699.1 hypothetical protein L3040_002574 [Drepanopeziza brunnea f. sp. 'multigermtubi']